MGTRHLIAVMHEGRYKLANYGQWDGYPSGQGVDILRFLRDGFDREAFIAGLNTVFAPTRNDLRQWWGEVGVDIDAEEFVSMHKSDAFHRERPSMSRNNGADILPMVQASRAPLPVKDQIDFAGDSLFCEYAYVIDLDKNTFEVFRGVNREPLPEGERFFGWKRDNDEYHPVRLLQSFDLADLPDKDGFLAELTEQEDD